MKAYGGTCPFCCGDIQRQPSRAGDAVCSFCGLALDPPEVNFYSPPTFSIVRRDRAATATRTVLDTAGERRAV